ncbi:MBL fold metallo-hydrolase [Paenibacillus filicis]|uniref:MBL fold metallo-hydrolase n=1 Tax=Paenibacillus filicis TaxID=669464 RepID=A0ABU9DV31_9BACL
MFNDSLLHVAGSSYAWSGKYAVGVYLHEESREAYLFDSGPNWRTAERIDREITNHGYEVAAIVYSHGHSVNTGGSAYFSKRYPHLLSYATRLSAPFIHDPSWLASLSFIPTKSAGTSLQVSERPTILTDMIPYRDDLFEINGIPFTIHTLPGHFSGMIGIQTPDDVLYCADALFGMPTLSRQKLLFFSEPHTAKQSLEKLKTIQASQFVLYHGGVHRTISELIDENISRLDEAYDEVLSLIEQQWQTPENIVQRIMSKYDFENNEKQYELAYSITQAYLAQLLNEGRISRVIRNGLLFYTRDKG